MGAYECYVLGHLIHSPFFCCFALLCLALNGMHFNLIRITEYFSKTTQKTQKKLKELLDTDNIGSFCSFYWLTYWLCRWFLRCTLLFIQNVQLTALHKWNDDAKNKKKKQTGKHQCHENKNLWIVKFMCDLKQFIIDNRTWKNRFIYVTLKIILIFSSLLCVSIQFYWAVSWLQGFEPKKRANLEIVSFMIRRRWRSHKMMPKKKNARKKAKNKNSNNKHSG